MRLIDAEQIGLTDMEIIMCDGDYKKALEMLIDKIANAPSIDAVPVVRCKDCKHRDAENGLCEGRGWPMQLVPDDGFCDKGERSEG